MRSFMPRQTIFFDLLMEVDKVSLEMVELFVKFAADIKNAGKYITQAEELEHQGDVKTHELIDKLNRTFITPFDREDIYMLVHELDEIIDLLEGVIRDVHLYGISQKVETIEDFVPLIQEASGCLQQLLGCLREMKHTSELSKLKIRIHELEDAGDEVFNRAIANLFKSEKDPLIVVKLKDILEGLE